MLREPVESLSLQIFKTTWTWSAGSCSRWPCCDQGGWTRWSPEVPANLSRCDPVIPGKMFLKQKMCPLFKRKLKKKKVVGEEKVSLALWILKTETDKSFFFFLSVFFFSFVVELSWVKIWIRVGRALVDIILPLLLSQKDCKPEMGIFLLACKSVGNNLVFWLSAFFSNEISSRFVCHLQAGISHLHHSNSLHGLVRCNLLEIHFNYVFWMPEKWKLTSKL